MSSRCPPWEQQLSPVLCDYQPGGFSLGFPGLMGISFVWVRPICLIHHVSPAQQPYAPHTALSKISEMGTTQGSPTPKPIHHLIPTNWSAVLPPEILRSLSLTVCIKGRPGELGSGKLCLRKQVRRLTLSLEKGNVNWES